MLAGKPRKAGGQVAISPDGRIAATGGGWGFVDQDHEEQEFPIQLRELASARKSDSWAVMTVRCLTLFPSADVAFADVRVFTGVSRWLSRMMDAGWRRGQFVEANRRRI